MLTISVREIDSVEALPALRSGDIDLAFARLAGGLTPPIQALPMAQERLVVAMPHDHAMAELPRIRLSSLAREGFVMFAPA